LTVDPDSGLVYATVNEDAEFEPLHDRAVERHDHALRLQRAAAARWRHRRHLLLRAPHPDQRVGARNDRHDAGAERRLPGRLRAEPRPGDGIATVAPLFFDEASATLANAGPGFGSSIQLALTDPDSNEDVPFYAQRFGGEFMETSQGDQQQIFLARADSPWQTLSVLDLSASVDGHGLAVGQLGNDLHDRQQRRHDRCDHRAVRGRQRARGGSPRVTPTTRPQPAPAPASRPITLGRSTRGRARSRR